LAKKSSTKNKKRDEKNKVQKDSPGIIAKAKADNILLYIMLALVAGLLFIGPFYRGLFFSMELLQAQIFVFAALFFWGLFRIFNRDGRLIETPLDICLLLLFIAYFISTFFAVHTRDALEELLKIASYLVIYLVAIDICRNWKYPGLLKWFNHEGEDTGSNLPPGISMFLHLLLAAATVLTIASLGVPAGHWDFVGAYASSRIASPMGYANTAAAYLMASYFMALSLAPLAKRLFRVIYLVPATLMLISIVLTFSRGAWLLLPPLALLMVIVSAPGQRLRTCLYLAVTALTALPAALLADPVFRSDNPVQAWWLIIGAVLAAVILGAMVEQYLLQSRKVRLGIAAAAAVIVTAAFIIFVIIPVVGPLHLENPPGEPARTTSYEQVISNIEAGETYQLQLEVKADQDHLTDSNDPDYVWRIRVLGGLPGYRDEELLDYRGMETEGWQQYDFAVETVEDTTRLDIRLYNRYPGTAITARNVTLVSPDSEQKLRFTMSRILPDRFYSRIYSYSLDRNLDRRLELFEDAVKVIRDYPILGAGGGAWAAVYRAYQDQPYDSREVHNHYLQVWIEAGILGFIAFVGIWLSFAAAFIRNCFLGRASPVRWQYWTATFLPVAALGVHSTIDWNFSMAAVGIFLFALLGAGRSLDQAAWFKKEDNKNVKSGKGLVIGIIALLLGLSLSIYSAVLLNGLKTTWESQQLLERGNNQRAMAEMERAIRLDPLLAENHHNLSVLIEGQARRTQTQLDAEQILALSRRAYELEPYNPNYFLRYGDLLMSHVDIDEGLSYIDKLMKMRPHNPSSYVRPAHSRLQVIEYFDEVGEQAGLQNYAGEIFELEEKMREKQGDSLPMAYVIGRTNQLLGNRVEAERYYEMVPEDDQFYDLARQRLEELWEEGENND